MTQLQDWEKFELQNFFRRHIDEEIVIQLAKSMTKNAMLVATIDEALEIILLHSTSLRTVLNKRLLTREILFKYLHNSKVPVTAEFTKVNLVDKIINYWSNRKATEIYHEPQHRTEVPSKEVKEFDFPIHLMSRQFSSWFFEKFNQSALLEKDFWTDSQLEVKMISPEFTDELNASTSPHIIQALITTKDKFNIYFNPNVNHDGAQGRMSIHGLVLVLSCGTIHTTEKCVGIFESIFGLMRDPFAENNWKVKTLKLTLKSTTGHSPPRLGDSDMIRQCLQLPAPSGDI